MVSMLIIGIILIVLGILNIILNGRDAIKEIVFGALSTIFGVAIILGGIG